MHDKVVAGPLPLPLIKCLEHTLLYLKPQAEECFQLGDSDRLKILGLLDLLGSQVCLAAQEPPLASRNSSRKDILGIFWGANVVSNEQFVYPGDSL